MLEEQPGAPRYTDPICVLRKKCPIAHDFGPRSTVVQKSFQPKYASAVATRLLTLERPSSKDPRTRWVQPSTDIAVALVNVSTAFSPRRRWPKSFAQWCLVFLRRQRTAQLTESPACPRLVSQGQRRKFQ